MQLDLKTLLLCLLIGQMFTIILILVYRSRYDAGDPNTSLFVSAKCLQSVVLVILMLKDSLDSQHTILVIALLALSGGILETIAILRILGAWHHTIKKYYSVLFGIAVVFTLLIHLFTLKESYVIAFISLAGALITIYLAYILLVKVEKTSLGRIIGLLYCTVILSLFGRALEPLFSTFSQSALVSDFLIQLFYLGIYLQMFLGTAGIMLLSREAAYTELERVATYDELTGILNRRSFVKRAQSLIATSATARIPFSFLLLDVDHFKSVNDTYGHNTGDMVLEDLARVIKRELRSDDLFGRFGGEEFAVLLYNADVSTSDEIAERMRKAVIGSVINGRRLHYTISIGVITILSGERSSLNTLYKRSDTALYQAKQRGRNCVVRSHGQSILSSLRKTDVSP